MKEKVDTCSPVGVLEDFFKSSDSETGSLKEPNTDFEGHKNPKQGSRWFGFAHLWRSKSKKSLETTNSSGVFKLSRRFGSLREIIAPKFGLYADLYNINSPWKNFSLFELQAATSYFSQGS